MRLTVEEIYNKLVNDDKILTKKGRITFNLGDIDPIFDFCAPAMAASHEVLKTRPEAVRKFLSVLDRAYREVAKDPDGTVLEVRDMLPQGYSDKMLIESQRHLAPILLDEQGRWGRIKPERWDRMADYMLSVGVISKRCNDEYTNEFFAE